MIPLVMHPVLGLLAGLSWGEGSNVHAWIGIAVSLHSEGGREAVSAVGILAGLGDYAHCTEMFKQSSYLH